MSQDTVPVPLHLPAILQNPTNRSARQVEAHNAQHREKVVARRDRDARTNWTPENNGRGKRVIRRLDNAAFSENPHVVRPSKSDYSPSVPLQDRPLRPSFPPDLIARSEVVAPAALPQKDPFSTDSRQGFFSTSLKGTRAMLRKHGKRAEGLVNKAEGEMRKWLGGDCGELNIISASENRWKAVDQRMVDYNAEDGCNRSSSNWRRLPLQHQLAFVPDLPVENGQIPAILEISRSPAHLSWYLPESFDRLVIHLLARYYELASWSEPCSSESGSIVRITHIILPNIAQPSRQPVSGHSLMTPETSEVSGQSSTDHHSSTSESEPDSDTSTERGDDDMEDYIFADTTATLPISEMADLTLSGGNNLTRTLSVTSSRYASSEGGSDFEALGDSLTHLRPENSVDREDTAGAWLTDDSDSDFGDVPGFSSPKNVFVAKPNIVTRVSVTARGWEDKPTFFDYLYGA